MSIIGKYQFNRNVSYSRWAASANNDLQITIVCDGVTYYGISVIDDQGEPCLFYGNTLVYNFFRDDWVFSKYREIEITAEPEQQGQLFDDFVDWLSDNSIPYYRLTINTINCSVEHQPPDYILRGGIERIRIGADSGFKFPSTIVGRVNYTISGAIVSNVFRANDTSIEITISNARQDVILIVSTIEFNDDVFSLVLYQNNAEPIVVDKTPYLDYIGLSSGTLRNATSALDLNVEIEYNKYPDFNYVYIPILKKYYYIEDVEIINNKLYGLSLHIDVLNTYYESLLEQEAFINRNEFDYNPFVVDSAVMAEQGVDIETYTQPNQLFTSTSDSTSNFLVVGGVYCAT